MAPRHGHFIDAVAPLGEQENLDVEREAIDRGLTEKSMSRSG